ncbi:hypothetical protein PMAYCL1PPCAC_24665, partial [Pristionchus mayeri]
PPSNRLFPSPLAPGGMSTVPIDVFFLVVSVAALIFVYVYKFVHNIFRKKARADDDEISPREKRNLTFCEGGPIITTTFYPPNEPAEKTIIYIDVDDPKEHIHCGFSSDGSNGADSQAS